jgi:hypothetical protein
MSSYEKVRSMRLKELKLPGHIKSALLLERRRGPRLYKRLPEEMALETATVGNAIDNFKGGMPYRCDVRLTKTEKRFVEALQKRGVTRLDWPYMPQSTVTLQVMQSIPRGKWLSMPAYLLGTLDLKTLKLFARMFQKSPEEIVVFDVLTLGRYRVRLVPELAEHHQASVRRTRDLLEQLGFADSTSAFMTFRL